MPPAPCTQKDIANALGFAQSTVAWALSPKYQARLPEKTVQVIQEKARKMNYRPHRAAQLLCTGYSYNIGVVYRSSSFHAPSERLRYLAEAAAATEYNLAPIDVSWFNQTLEKVEEQLDDNRVEGLIICNGIAEEQDLWSDYAQRKGIPLVIIGGPSIIPGRIDADLHRAFKEMTIHHLAQGSRRLHLLLPFHDGPPWHASIRDIFSRWVDSFRSAIEETGGEVIGDEFASIAFQLPTRYRSPKSSIRACIHYRKRPTEEDYDVFDHGYYGSQAIAEKEEIDSLICTNDQIAAGAITALFEKGIRIPQDVRISGGDDSPFSRYAGIPLTTIKQPCREMASLALNRMVKLIATPEEPVVFSDSHHACQLILRRSTTG